MSDDLFNFICFLSIDKVRRWHREVLFVNSIFLVWSENISMKDWMSLPSFWEKELVNDRR